MTDSLATTASTRVLLKDCCEEISQRIDNPAESGFERFVGLEHLKTGEMSIRNWGSTEDVTSSMKLFKAGDVIVARRNVYLRRAARAHFDGVCSGDGIVLRGKSGICLPDLLPFLLNTDAFWDYVTSQADGTMSKRITVRRLLSYEFALPPLEEQRQITKALMAASAYASSYRDAAASLDAVLQATLQHDLSAIPDCAPLSDWCQTPISYGIVQAGPDIPGGVPYVRVSDMTEKPILQIEGMLRTSDEIATKYQRTTISAGDVVVALRWRVGLSMIVPPELDGANISRGVARLAVKNEYVSEFLYWALRSTRVRQQILRVCNAWKGDGLSEITIEELRNLPIPIPSRDDQLRISKKLRSIADSLAAILERQTAAQDTADALAREYL